MIKIAICDDDESSVTRLAGIVEQYTRRNNLPFEVNTFSSGVAMLEKFNGYDLIFLDIDMPEMNGIDVAKKIREKDIASKIIYVTSHHDYMMRAFSVHPFNFVTKPFTEQEIFNNIEEFLRCLKLEKNKNTLDFKNAKERVTLNADEIIYFEYKGNQGVKIVTAHESVYIHLTLQDVLKKSEEYGFAMSHQSFAVNLLHVKSIKGENITMSNGDIVPLAQKRAVSFKRAHNQFIQEM